MIEALSWSQGVRPVNRESIERQVLVDWFTRTIQKAWFRQLKRQLSAQRQLEIIISKIAGGIAIECCKRVVLSDRLTDGCDKIPVSVPTQFSRW
jgi:hypothetical protein